MSEALLQVEGLKTYFRTGGEPLRATDAGALIEGWPGITEPPLP